MNYALDPVVRNVDIIFLTTAADLRVIVLPAAAVAAR